MSCESKEVIISAELDEVGFIEFTLLSLEDGFPAEVKVRPKTIERYAAILRDGGYHVRVVHPPP